ncbi:N-acyl-D-amino-acid deacylase family protein [Pseudoduganella violacea]|uniref:N-acyl-D-amino-acid deacylase n=1 Tax=Pseudoduganella violacea TaxID=1715466 RepID=A0A7W5B5V3_9BURK|nr:D-aminoacylase [Pseudoduganella violacea]MBB3117148.1 N-acyl-D-amino-acid deacylase [Pseudoduganella violacea]
MTTPCAMPSTPSSDLLIHDAEVYDGSGSPAFRADVAVRAGRIAAIAAAGSLQLPPGARLIDAQGLALAPGFIDVHTHDDRQVLDSPAMLPKLTQGVTTVITGNCGISLAPWQATMAPPAPLSLIGTQPDYRYASVADYASAVQDAGPAVNVGMLVGHSTLRVNAMRDTQAPATAQEIEAMRALLDEGMRAGALGFSSGLFYKTSSHANNDEVIALASVAAEHGGIYTSHIRDEYDGVIDALNEACDAGRAARLPVVLSHHKCAGPANWGRSSETLALITERRRTQAVGLDAYPYVAGSTVLDPDYVDGVIRIMVSWSQAHPQMAGRDLSDIAAEWGVDQKEAARRLHPAGAVYFQMREDDVRRVLSYPHTMIGSDGLPHDAHPHPRLWGSFPRVLGHYCREEQLFTLPEAIRRMSSLSADTFGLKQRGRVAVGCWADLVLFDPATVADRASFAQPKQAAAGIVHVLVNGEVALEGGVPAAARHGRVLRRQEERYSPAE